MDKEKCPVMICYANGKRVMCGDVMLGKKRYCSHCVESGLNDE